MLQMTSIQELDSRTLPTDMHTVTSRGIASSAHSRRNIVLKALLIFAVALIVRVLFFTVQAAHFPGGWGLAKQFREDEMSEIAANLAHGRGYSSPFEPGSSPTAWVCPLIPLLWAFIIRCMGGTTGLAHLMIAYSGTVPSAACVVLYWLIVRHMLRGSPALRRTAFLAVAIFCVWPDSLYVLDVPWYFPWQELGTAVMVLLGMKWIDQPTLKSATWLGIVAGILALINVTPMPIFIVILLLPLVQNRTHWKRLLGYGSVSATLALLITLPWLIRNAVVLHAFVPLRSNAGLQFWEGNNPDGCVSESAISRHPGILRSELDRYRAMGEIAYCRQGYRDGFNYIRAHPGQALLRTAERAYAIWLTDTFSQWRWTPDTPRWWHQGMPAIRKHLSSTLAAWGLVILLIWAVFSKRLEALPYKWLFFWIVFCLPFPYYFTLADDQYSQILRSWLLLLAILAFSAGFRIRSTQRQVTIDR